MTPPAISPTGGWLGTILFVILFVAALALFGVRVGRLITLLQKARPEDRTDHMGDRVGAFFKVVLGQSGVLRDPIPGIAHFFTFWGFILIQFGLLNLILGAFNGSIPFLGDNRVFAIVLDVFVVLVLFALIVFAIRRGIVRPRQLNSSLHGPWDGFIILGLILLVIVTLALVEAFEYAASNGAAWTPIGAFFAPLFTPLGKGADIAAYRTFWWLHILTVLGFLVYLPRSKHLHLMATPFNVFFRSYKPKGELPLIENLEDREDYGVSKVEQFTWKQLLDGYACTECGRCNTVCPALNTGKPLYPKEIILGVKEALFVRSGEILGENSIYNKLGVAGIKADKTPEEKEAHHEPMVGGIISQEALWSCTTCMACMEICPVSIEHVPKIVDMRRSLVMEESEFPQEVTSLFNNIERNGNPWEISNDKRAEWAASLEIPLLAENPDAEVLYWVGCMGSFDRRNQQVATSVAKVLKAANVDFAILGPEETCTGDPARRIGNEYLWQMQAMQNIETLNGYGFNTRPVSDNDGDTEKEQHEAATAVATANALNNKHRTIITACPHCFNTIKNEYPQLGGNYEVVHHTVFIDSLMENQKLKLLKGFDKRKLTYHDPCYVGRYNDTYDEPRRVLTVLNSNGITEMGRNRNKSFCCGGGGGRVWMEEKVGKRVNQTRVNEALETNAEVLAAGCPFCITMFEDGVKGVEAEEKMKVEDISEIIARAIETK
ncbi:4Fe-4S dicluster domain-containing protein [Dictyobacter aurantiacus]|uniref:(Fe-S)-binding protein n=1 Tax=Dictyobacter aurantiacus TaxID=1936993 RepID=A0A401ZHQ1_9CHLR|nr:(Fe-S)-binding protein [Dictyobacter aurantiacus]GCE06228.1 (Fe-S)-binding protein [Dictyobacter aurantiacus]